jgi:ATP-dependent RNA helicase RhlE
MAYEPQKIALLKELLRGKTEYQSILIFTSRKASVKGLVREIDRMGFSVSGMNSDLDQKEREEVLLRFRNREIRILVATNIVSRGIDIDGIDLVVNFDVPPDPEDYVHRIGRTARAQNAGVAITLISDRDQSDFKKIEELIGSEIIKLTPPAELGDSPVYNPTIRKRSEKNPSNKARFKNSRHLYRKKSYHRKENGTKVFKK